MNLKAPLLLALLASCADTTPFSIELAVPPAVYSSTAEVIIASVAKNKKGEVLLAPTPPPSLAVSPPEKAVVLQGGKIRCLKSGDVTVTATAGAVTGNGVLHCRLIGSISVTPVTRVLVGREPSKVDVNVRSEDGESLTDVPVSITSSEIGVLQVVGGSLLGLSVGRATVDVRAGEKTDSFQATVIRQVKNEPLLLNDGARINQPLSAGNYEVGVEVRGGEVTLQWVGGQGCEDSGKATKITRTCRIAESGAVIVENPSFLGIFGSGASDGVMRIFEVPSDS